MASGRPWRRARRMARSVISLGGWAAPEGGFNYPGLVCGLVIAFMTGIVIIGGI